MRALLSFIVSTASFGSSLLAGVAAAAEPFNWSPQVDDPIHTPAELVESMHSAFGYNHCRAVHAKGLFSKASLPRIPMPKKLPRRLICKGQAARSRCVSPILAVFQLFQTMTRWPIREVWQSDSNCPAVRAPMWQLTVSTGFPFPTRMTYAS